MVLWVQIFLPLIQNLSHSPLLFRSSEVSEQFIRLSGAIFFGVFRTNRKMIFKVVAHRDSSHGQLAALLSGLLDFGQA